MTCGDGSGSVEKIKVQEHTIKTTKSYEFIPVENVVEDTIELIGQKYSKKELEDALRSLKPVV
jgi:hypothetical protein